MDQQEAAYAAQEIESRLRIGHFVPSLVLQLCDYVRKPARDTWQASSPVPTASPRDLRDWLLANPQLSDDARVKYLLGVCHAAIGELLAEVDKAKPFAGERPPLLSAPIEPAALCAILSSHKLTDDPYLRDILDQCHGVMSCMNGERKQLSDMVRDVRLAVEGKQPLSLVPLVNAVIDLHKRANSPRVDPWQTSGQIPDEAEQLCAFILNNHLTDDDRMQNLLLRCHSKILALLGEKRKLAEEWAAEHVAVEQALKVGYWDESGAPAELLHESAQRIRAELDRVCSTALPAEIASVSEQISDAKDQWNDGCGKMINEVFRSCDTLLDAVLVLTVKEDQARAAAIKAVDLLQREIAASLSPEMIEQAVKLGTRANDLTSCASPGPWVAERGIVRATDTHLTEVADCTIRLRHSGGRYNDADFIAEARSIVPAMSELLVSIARRAGSGRVLPDEVAALVASVGAPCEGRVPMEADGQPEKLAMSLQAVGQLQREIERLDAELTVAKKHVAEAEERAAHNETRAVEEGHRVMAAERKYAELSSLLDQRLSAPLSDIHRDLSDIDQLLDKTSLLVTLCSGGPWILCAEAGELTVLDAGKCPVAMLVEPAPGNLETRNYNGKFVAASRGLVVNLVEVARRLVSGLRHSRTNNDALQSLSRDKDQEIAALNDKLTRAKAEQDAEVQRRVDVVGAGASQREADLRRIIGNQQLRSEKFREQTAALEERLRQALAEVVFVRDSLENTMSRAQAAETELNEAKGLLSKKTAEVAQLTADLNKALAGEQETCATADRLRDELDAHERRIHLQQSRTAAANRLWQKETGRRDTIPDLGDLIAWLLKRAGAAEKKLAQATERQTTADSLIDELANGIRAYRVFADGRADDIREDCWWTRAAVAWEKDHGGRVTVGDPNPIAAPDWQPRHLVEIAAAGLAVCKENGWKRDWQHGGIYLHLEASEFVEALRGKGTSTPEAGAADVLFVLLTVCAANGVSLEKALSNLRELCRMKDGRLDIAGGAVYLIQDSRQYVGNDVLWWRPKSEGYTCQIEEAGLYDEAFVRNRRDTDKVYRAADIYPLATRVVDVQRIHSAGVKPVTFDKDPAR